MSREKYELPNINYQSMISASDSVGSQLYRSLKRRIEYLETRVTELEKLCQNKQENI